MNELVCPEAKQNRLLTQQIHTPIQYILIKSTSCILGHAQRGKDRQHNISELRMKHASTSQNHKKFGYIIKTEQ